MYSATKLEINEEYLYISCIKKNKMISKAKLDKVVFVLKNE